MIVPATDPDPEQTLELIGDLNFDAPKRLLKCLIIVLGFAIAVIGVGKLNQRATITEEARERLAQESELNAQGAIAARQKRDSANSVPPPVTWSAPDDHAEKPKGMTYENYLKLEDGMYFWDVEVLLDFPTTVENSKSGSLRTVTYRKDNGSEIVVTYQDDKLAAKSQFGLK